MWWCAFKILPNSLGFKNKNHSKNSCACDFAVHLGKYMNDIDSIFLIGGSVYVIEYLLWGITLFFGTARLLTLHI